MRLTSDHQQLQLEENQLRAQVASLTVPQKRQYYAQEMQNIKDPDTYAALNWAFAVGLHHFYLGNWQRGMFNLVLMLSGLLCYFSGIFSLFGVVLMAFVFAIELPQVFNGQKIIYRYNNQLMKSILKQFYN